MDPESFQRLAVVGTSGCGKTTLADLLSRKLGSPHIELDALHWDPNWTEVEPEIFKERIATAVAGKRWVTDGNYSAVREIIWERASRIVWLDYSLPLMFHRLLRRTLTRAWSREELWNGNRESFVLSFLSRESVLLWQIRTYRERRQRFHELFSRPEYADRCLRFRFPGETEAWVRSLPGDPTRARDEEKSSPG